MWYTIPNKCKSENYMDYLNEICPVCGRPFAAGDDIVVCPDCGTPHHRECWKIKNACENQHLHGEGFEWKPSAPLKLTPAAAFSDSGENKDKPENGTAPVLPVFNTIENEEDFEKLLLRGTGYKKDDTIDGVSVGDAVLYIQQGAKGYIRKFKTKKFSFNWAAFFFTPAWFFYRKMYKAGAVLLALVVALSLFTYPMLERLNDSTQAFQSKVEQIAGDDKNLSSSALAENEDLLEDSKSLMKGYFVYSAINMLFPGLLSALIANQIYKKKMLKDIADIKKEAENEGEGFEKALIIRRGGVSLLWGAAVLFASAYLPELLLQIADFFSNTF